jgi:hypothetical protein
LNIKIKITGTSNANEDKVPNVDSNFIECDFHSKTPEGILPQNNGAEFLERASLKAFLKKFSKSLLHL